MPNTYIDLTKEEFENYRPINNNVIVEITHSLKETTRQSGLIIVNTPESYIAKELETAEKFDATQHLDRCGTVVKIPTHLKCNKKNKPGIWMDWKTEIEIQVGDIVWHDWHEASHCLILKVEDKQYRVLNYQ